MYQEIEEKCRTTLQNNKSFRHYSDASVKEVVEKLNAKNIVTISGLKKLGKLGLVQAVLRKTGQENSVFFFSRHQDTFKNIVNKVDLITLMDIHVRQFGVPKFVILEDCNDIEDIKSLILDLYNTKKYKIILVGNNIQVENIPNIEVFPLALSTENINSSLHGGIPETFLVSDLNYKAALNAAFFHQIIVSDVIEPYKIKDSELFIKVLSFLAGYIIPMSGREIHRGLESHGVHMSLITLMEYLNIASNVKLIKKVAPFDIKKQNSISTKNTYYFGDVGIARYMGVDDDSLLQKNALILELTSRSYSLESGIFGRFHFDIIARKKTTNIYMHFDISSDKNEIRKTARKLAKVEGDAQRYVIVQNKENIGMRKFEEEGVQIMSFEEMIGMIQS